jgi:hypothetical protein
MDKVMLEELDPCAYIKFIFATLVGKGLGDPISRNLIKSEIPPKN